MATTKKKNVTPKNWSKKNWLPQKKCYPKKKYKKIGYPKKNGVLYCGGVYFWILEKWRTLLRTGLLKLFEHYLNISFKLGEATITLDRPAAVASPLVRWELPGKTTSIWSKWKWGSHHLGFLKMLSRSVDPFLAQLAALPVEIGSGSEFGHVFLMQRAESHSHSSASVCPTVVALWHIYIYIRYICIYIYIRYICIYIYILYQRYPWLMITVRLSHIFLLPMTV